jgi:hypothetical protein
MAAVCDAAEYVTLLKRDMAMWTPVVEEKWTLEA